MQSQREETLEEDSNFKMGKLSAPQSGEKQVKDKGVYRLGSKELSQVPSPSPFNAQANSSLGYYNNSNQNKYVDIEYSSIEAERTIKKKINGDNLFQINQNSTQQQWNEQTMTKLYREGAQSPNDQSNNQKTQFLNRKQQTLNYSFDSSQNSKKMNNFINIDGINLQKIPQKQKLQVKRERANKSLNSSPAGKRNPFVANQQNQSQYKNLKEGNSTININDIINNSGGVSTTSFMATNYNTTTNNDLQSSGVKSFQKLIEASYQKRKVSNSDLQEFPQIVQTNKSSQSQFERILKSKPSAQGRVTPKILQENLTNSNKSSANIASINIRRKSTQFGNGVINQQEIGIAGYHKDIQSHQSSKENGFRGQTSDESGDDLSFEGRYKQKQLFSLKQKIKLQKQNNNGGVKIYAEKEDLVQKMGVQGGQQQLEMTNENFSPTYNVISTGTSLNSKQNGRNSINQYLQQQPIVSQINTNRAHTKLKLEEIKNAYQRQNTHTINSQLTNNLKQQIQQSNQNKIEKQQQSSKNSPQINKSSEKSRFSNLIINTRQEDVILEDENDGTLTINEDDFKLKGSQQTHYNSPQKIMLDQSFQVVQNKHLEEDLENWKEERELLREQSSAIQEEDSKVHSLRGNENISILGNDSIMQQKQLENLSKKSAQENYEENKKKPLRELQNQIPFKILNNQETNQINMCESMIQMRSPSLQSDYIELKGYSEQRESRKKSQYKQFHSLHQKSSKKMIEKNENDNTIQNDSQKKENEDEIFEDLGDEIQINNQSLAPSQTSQILQIHDSDELPKLQEKENDQYNSDYEKASSVSCSLTVLSQNNSTCKKDFNQGQEDNRKAKEENKIQLQNSNISVDNHKHQQNEQVEQVNEECLVNQKQQTEESKDPYIDRQDEIVKTFYNKQNENLSKQIEMETPCQKHDVQMVNLEEGDILNKTDFQTIILWEQQISELSGCFKSQNATRCYNSVVSYCSQYLMLIRSRSFDKFAILFTDDRSRKIIRSQMNLEHLGIIVLLYNYLDRKNFLNNINTIRNIVSYIHQNFILLVDLIVSKVSSSHKSLMNANNQDLHNDPKQSNQENNYSESMPNIISFVKDIAAQNIHRKKMNKIQDFLQALKQNNEILLNLYRSTTKHDKDFYNHIGNLSKFIEKSNNTNESLIQILNTFALYLTILENTIGFQPLPFLAVCPAPYLLPLKQQQKNEEFEQKIICKEINGSKGSENNIENNSTTLETQPKEENSTITNSQQNQILKQDKTQVQNQNRQTNKITQNPDQVQNKTQRNQSKQQGKGSNNISIKRSATPNSTVYSNKNNANQQDNRKVQNPQTLIQANGPIRRKSSSFSNSNSANNIKSLREEKINQSRQYTLVLDLDETLVHYSETNSGGQFVVRPFAPKFLEILSEYYEIVVFTAAMPDYANWVLDNLDPNKYISHRLFRQHAVHIGNVFIKDLSRIGRPLEKTIIIDNVADNFQLQPENGIFIKGWFSDPNDTALSELLPLLKEMVNKKVTDVRKALKSLKEQMILNIQNGVQNPHLNLKLD